MSKLWKKPNYTPRQLENGWMNILWNTHDQICNCNDPLLHLFEIINRDCPARKPTTDLRNILCLLTGDTTKEEDSGKEDDPGFLEGELEKLFEENGGEKEEDPER